MKILQVIPSLGLAFGGPSNAALELSSALVKQGHDVTIYTTDADVLGRMPVPLDKPVNLRGVKIFYFQVKYLRHYKLSFSLARAIKKNISYFDIVHIHSLFQFSTLAAAYYSRKFSKPYIIRPLGQLDPFLLKNNFFFKHLYLLIFERNNLLRAAAVHCTSEQEKGWCDQLRLDINSVVLPLGINLAEFKSLPARGEFRARYNQLEGKEIILFFGRISFKKGLDILVKAFSDLARERRDLWLVIAGPDNEGYKEKVRVWLKESGLFDRVIFTGLLSGIDKLAVLRDSDVFVLSSYSENFGISVIEALASGLPVIISSRVGVAPDVLEYEAGIVTENKPDQISGAISRLLDDEGLRQITRENGLRLVQERFNIDGVTEKLLNLYSRVIAKIK